MTIYVIYIVTDTFHFKKYHICSFHAYEKRTSQFAQPLPHLPAPKSKLVKSRLCSSFIPPSQPLHLILIQNPFQNPLKTPNLVEINQLKHIICSNRFHPPNRPPQQSAQKKSRSFNRLFNIKTLPRNNQQTVVLSIISKSFNEIPVASQKFYQINYLHIWVHEQDLTEL